MDRNKLKKAGESHNFMEKLFTRLKMTKHPTKEKLADVQELTLPSSSDSKPFILWNCNKLTAENVMQFSDQLYQLLQYLNQMKEVTFYIYDFPNQLNCKLEKEAVELRNLFRDARAAAIDIDRLKKQRYAIKKEKSLISKKLDKLREEEMKELESIINVYAKPLYRKWESVKNTQKPEVLENFMNEIIGKSTAMEILKELIKRKLSKLAEKQSPCNKFALKRNISSSNIGIRLKNQERITSFWNSGNSQETVKLLSQPVNKSAKPTSERDAFKVNRRKKQREVREEKRKQNIEFFNSAIKSDNSCGLDLQLTPIDDLANENIHEVIASHAPEVSDIASKPFPVVNVDYTSDDDSISLTSNDFDIDNFVHGINAEMQTDLPNDIRNALQILFGKTRQIPHMNFGSRNRHNNNGNDLRSPGMTSQ